MTRVTGEEPRLLNYFMITKLLERPFQKNRSTKNKFYKDVTNLLFMKLSTCKSQYKIKSGELSCTRGLTRVLI